MQDSGDEVTSIITKCGVASDDHKASSKTAWFHRTQIYSGDFLAPFDKHIRDRYCYNNLSERSPMNNEAIPVYEKKSKNTVLLEVGNLLFTDWTRGVGNFIKYTIVDFERGTIILDPFIILKISDINLDTDIHIRYNIRGDKTPITYRLNRDDTIFVLQKSAVTARLKNKRNDAIQKTQKQTNEALKN